MATTFCVTYNANCYIRGNRASRKRSREHITREGPECDLSLQQRFAWWRSSFRSTSETLYTESGDSKADRCFMWIGMAVYARGAGSVNCTHHRRQNKIYLLLTSPHEVCRKSGSRAEMDRLDASPKSEDVHSACVIGSYFAVSGLRLCTLVGTSST